MKQKNATCETLEHKVAQLELQLQEQKHLDFFFQHSSDGYFFMMLDEPVHWNVNTDREATLDYIFAHQKITRFNEAILKQNRIEASQYEGLTPNDIYKDDLTSGRRLWSEFLDRGDWKLEQEIKTSETQKPLIVQCEYQAIYDEEGRFCGHFGVQRDITTEKHTLQKLREAQDFSQAVLNSLEANICVLDSGGEIIATNEAWRSFSSENGGVPKQTNETANYLDVCEVITKRNAKEWEDDQEAKQAYEGIDSVLNQGANNFTLEYPCHSKQQERWFFMQVTALKRQEGGAVVSHLDITPLKKAHQQIEINKAHLLLQESVITHLNDAILITDAEPVQEPGPIIRFCNPAFTRMTGYLPEDVIGRTPRLLQGPKTDKNVLNELSQALENWQSIEVELINYKKNGEEFWVNFSLVPIVSNTGWYTHWVSVQKDITERKQQEEVLRHNELKYRTLFEDAPTAIILFAPDTLLPVEFNDQTLNLLQYSREEFAQMQLSEYAIDDGVVAKMKESVETVKQTQVTKFDAALRRKDGSHCLMEVIVRVINVDGQELFFNIWTDVTQKKLATEQIRIGEERFRKAIDSSLDAIYVLETVLDEQQEVIDFIFVDMNLEGRKQLIFLGKEVLGQRLCEVHPINREEGYFDRYKNVFLSGEMFDGEFPIYVEGYAPQWTHQTVVKLDSGVVIIARDVTLRRTANDSIRLSEERFRSAIDSSLDAFYILDACYDDAGEVVDFIFVEMNRVGLQAIKLPKEKIYHQKLCEVLPINREQGFFEKYKKVFLTGETLDEEVLVSTEKLSFTWVHHTIVKLKNGIAITTRDITPGKEYEAKLEQLNEDLQHRNETLLVQEEQLHLANEELLAQQDQLKILLEEITYNEQKFRSLAENIKDVFWIRKGNKIEYISPAYEQIWQRPVEELYDNDDSFLDALPMEDRQHLVNRRKSKEYQRKGLLNEEYRVQRPDGTMRWVEVRTFPVEINEAIFHVVGIGKDITEAKEAEVRLQELNVALALKNQELIAQEEELRMTNEELKANKETLEKALELLSVSESNLKALFDSSEQAIILLDTQFKVISFNRSVHDFHDEGFMQNFKPGVNVLECFGENVHLAQAYRDKFEKCLQGDIIAFERQLNYPDFTNIRWIETTLLPVRDQLDRIIGLSFNEKDVTDQRKIEFKLRRSEVRLRGLMNNTIQSFFLMDKNLRLLLYNASAERFTKNVFDKKLKMGESFLKFAPEEWHKIFQEKFFQALKGEVVTNEREIIYQNGMSAWFEVTYAPIKDVEGSSQMVIFSTLDITQRKQAQEREKRLLQEQIAYHLKQERLKRASILEGQERESHRISRELHDGVGQMLSALSYQINHLETTMEESRQAFVSKAYDEQIKPTSERAKKLLKEVIQEIREISHNLMPKILVDYGLIEALKQLRLDFSAGTNIPINLDIFCESERFEDNIEISVFRIAQEAVNNILKYAQATEVNIQLIEHATNLQLLVEDNGKGFEPDAVKHKNSNGLINMEERTRLVNGHFAIDTELGKGTCIMVEIPLKTNDNNI